MMRISQLSAVGKENEKALEMHEIELNEFAINGDQQAGINNEGPKISKEKDSSNPL